MMIVVTEVVKKSERPHRSRRTHPKTRHDFPAALDRAQETEHPLGRQRLITPWVDEVEICLDATCRENFRETAL